MTYTTIIALAKRLGISRNALHKRLSGGFPLDQVPPWRYTDGGRRYWTEADVATWIEEKGIIKTRRRPAGQPKGTT